MPVYERTHKHLKMARTNSPAQVFRKQQKFGKTVTICLAMTNVRHARTRARGTLGFATCNYLYTFSEDTQHKFAYFPLVIANSLRGSTVSRRCRMATL